MADPRLIDVRHLGRERVIGCWETDGLLVDPGPESCLETLVGALGDEPPRALLLTHIHLDHAGASGALVRRWPQLEVWVHEIGAPHMEDPARLLASASRLYGDDMQRLWGEVVPVPAANIRTLAGGETVHGMRVAHVPGHASHHVAYLHEESGTAFTGDVAGVRVGTGPVLAPTPPPEIDVELWLTSLDTLAAWRPARIAATHFGPDDDVPARLAAVRGWLEEWAPLARDLDEDGWVARFEEWLTAQTGAETVAAYVQAAPPEQLWAGLARYWRRRAE